jgi:hypothetical protein
MTPSLLVASPMRLKLVVAVDPGHLALAAAEDSALEAHLIERMSGYDEAVGPSEVTPLSSSFAMSLSLSVFLSRALTRSPSA